MEQYISKSAVAAELEKRKNQFVSQAESFRKIGKKEQESYFAALASNMNSLLSFLDTLEAKEVDEDYNGKAMLHVLEKGVEQGKREMLNKTYIWLKGNKDHPFIGCEDCCLSGFLTDEFIEEFRKAMED